MRYNLIYKLSLSLSVVGLLFSCKEDALPERERVDDVSDNVIEVGVEIDGLSMSATDPSTRAAAEQTTWLIQPLKKGLDITYGKSGDESTERVAILKLLGGTETDNTYATNASSGYAEYSFCYRGTDGAETTEKAKWYDNGYHYFEGVHVPARLRYKDDVLELEAESRSDNLAPVKELSTNQSSDTNTGTDNDLGNYTLLGHFLGMPANTRISATVARIKLPFKHRLARVLAYILIDPELKHNGASAKIKGYQSTEAEQTSRKDDPNTSSIRFCNVDVLEGVHDVYNETTKLHTLTPKWAEKVRKVVPHFSEELSEVKSYESEKKTLYPQSAGYDAVASADGHQGYVEKVYYNVPVYDLIVRPTYTSADNVMYDENLGGISKEQYAALTNQIDFTVSLDNGLTYEKHFEFDLDANYQTIVYLKITHEGVDYNESGTEIWVETEKSDQWYGLDNQNGHKLSKAGSSWQRAFYNTGLGGGESITDGGFYDENTSGEDGTKGQYVSDATWIEYFSQAYKGGEHHGDYFVLAKDITIDASKLPAGFVFTGHLDGYNTQGSRGYHTITLTNMGGRTALFSGLNGIYSTKQEEEEAAGNPIYNQGWSWEANVHKEKGNWVPYRDVAGTDVTKHSGWRAEVMNLTVKGGALFTEGAAISGYVQNCLQQTTEGGETQRVQDHIPAYPKYK